MPLLDGQITRVRGVERMSGVRLGVLGTYPGRSVWLLVLSLFTTYSITHSKTFSLSIFFFKCETKKWELEWFLQAFHLWSVTLILRGVGGIGQYQQLSFLHYIKP